LLHIKHSFFINKKPKQFVSAFDFVATDGNKFAN
jgi:hypothetical protein